MPTTRIFIGSSSAAKRQAKVVADHFESDTVKFVRWWEAFTPGRTLLGDLDAICDEVDAALLIMSPESPSRIRGNDVMMPNLNVMFEFGYFYGKLGASKTAMLPYGDFYRPSDLAGYTHITGSRFFKPSASVVVGKRTQESFGKWLSAV